MKKLAMLLTISGVLAVGWSAIVLNIMNDPIPESQDRVVHVDAVEIVPEAVPEAVQKAVEPQTVESTIVEERVSIVQEKPYWRKFLDEKKLISEYHADAVNCIDHWKTFLNASSTFRLTEVSAFRQSDEATKNSMVE